MIVGEADCPSVKINEMYRVQPTLADLPSISTLDLLPPLRHNYSSNLLLKQGTI
jgi:hypothetical protein